MLVLEVSTDVGDETVVTVVDVLDSGLGKTGGVVGLGPGGVGCGPTFIGLTQN